MKFRQFVGLWFFSWIVHGTRVLPLLIFLRFGNLNVADCLSVRRALWW